MTRAVVAYVLAAVLLSAGAWWFSPGAGLLVAGVCTAALATLTLVEVDE